MFILLVCIFIVFTIVLVSITSAGYDFKDVCLDRFMNMSKYGNF